MKKARDKRYSFKSLKGTEKLALQSYPHLKIKFTERAPNHGGVHPTGVLIFGTKTWSNMARAYL